MLLLPLAAHAQYFDGLPPATLPLGLSNIIAICQGGTVGIPGTCVTGQTPLSALFPGGTGFLPIIYQVTNPLTGGSGTSTNTLNQLTITGAPNANLWDGLDRLIYNGTGGTGQHVARYAQTQRYNFAAGGATDNPQLWGMVSEMDDFTGQPSAATNANLSMEFDLTGHNIDNGTVGTPGNRQALSVVIEPAADNGNFFEAGTGISIQTTPGAYTKSPLRIAGPVTNAGIDLRSIVFYGVGSTQVTVTAPVSASVTVPVSNVMPFTSDRFGRDINLGSFTTTVTFSDGQTATETAYAVIGSGPTPTGTITLSAPITEASGNHVGNTSNGIWLPTGLPIAFDTGGVTSISSNGSTVTLNAPNTALSGALAVKSNGGIMVGTGAAAFGGLDAGGLVFTFGLPLRNPGFAAASLPSIPNGDNGSMVWCNNCTNLNEFTAGHGVLLTLGTDGSYRTPWGKAPSTTGSNLTLAEPLVLPVYTVGTLPTCNSGIANSMAAVSDATTPTYNGALTGSGAVHVPVFCDGSVWTSH
jgi:hypothetical protein